MFQRFNVSTLQRFNVCNISTLQRFNVFYVSTFPLIYKRSTFQRFQRFQRFHRFNVSTFPRLNVFNVSTISTVRSLNPKTFNPHCLLPRIGCFELLVDVVFYTKQTAPSSLHTPQRNSSPYIVSPTFASSAPRPLTPRVLRSGCGLMGWRPVVTLLTPADQNRPGSSV